MVFKQLLFLFLLFSISISAQQKSEINLDALKAKLIKEGKQAYFKKDLNNLKRFTKKIDSLYKKNNDSTLLARWYHFKALEHKIEYTSDSAFYYYHKSKNINKLLKDSLKVGRRLLSIANLQRQAKDFLGSEISSIEALKYLEPIKAYRYLVSIYNNLGINSRNLNQKNNVIKYYKEALRLNKLEGDDSRKLYSLNNLGTFYNAEKEYKKAKKYFNQGLAFDSLQTKLPEHYASLLSGLTTSELGLGIKKNTLQNYNTVLNIRKKIKNISSLGSTHYSLSLFYNQEKNIKKAKYHINEALKYAKQSHNNALWLDALKFLSILNKGEKSVAYLNEYIQLNDSLLQKERTLKNQFAKIRYETDKKEKENTFLKVENKKNEVEISYEKQQKAIGWLLFLASLFGLGFSILFYFSRKRKLIYENKLQKILVREEERQQIAKSLHDEVAGDLRMLHQKLQKSELFEEAEKLDAVKENVRELSHKLNSISFEKVSFKNQVVNLVSDYFEPNFKIKVKGINDVQWQFIDDAIKRLLYLSMREGIQNCQKHAKATKMVLDFSLHKKTVFLSIIDNGIGFDANNSKKGIGLQNLEERLEDLNGTLIIDSEPNKGAEIYIQIPLNAYKNKNTNR